MKMLIKILKDFYGESDLEDLIVFLINSALRATLLHQGVNLAFSGLMTFTLSQAIGVCLLLYLAQRFVLSMRDGEG